MKTTIEFKDGHVETVDDSMPVCSADDNTVGCVDAESICLTDDVPLRLVSKVIFEND